MSHIIINRLFNPSVCRNFLRHTNVRLFTSDQPYPFLLVDHILKTPNLLVGGSMNGHTICRDKNDIFITDKKVMRNVCDAMTVGFSRDGLRVYEDYKGHAAISYSSSDPSLKAMTVSLPALPAGSQIQSLAMSSLPIRDKDWSVCVKLSGSRLSLCRPFGSSKWINIKNAPESINPLASLMFSKTDKRFYIPSPGGNYLCYLEKDTGDKLSFIYLELDHLPSSVYEEVVEVSSCLRTDHLVESPTGQLFLVKWYSEDSDVWDKDSVLDSEEEEKDKMPILKYETKKFLVFRAEEMSDKYDKTMIYTEDIGDLCIFLGHSEAYCVPASSSPGLKPNCIYFVGRDFGVYDLTTKTCTTFLHQDGVPVTRTKFPYWSSPVPL